MIIFLSFDISRIFISIVLLVSILSKRDGRLIEGNTADEKILLFLQFLEKIHLPFTIFLIFLFVGSGSKDASSFGATLLLLLMCIGFYLKKKKIIDDCNCYGNMTSDSKTRELLLNSLLIFCSFLIIFLNMSELSGSLFVNGQLNIWLFLGILLFSTIWANGKAFLLVIQRIRNGRNAKSQLVPVTNNDVTEKVVFSADLILGENEKKQSVTMGEIASDASLVLFVGLSNTCASCVASKPLLFRLAESFSFELKTVFVFSTPPESLVPLNGATLIHGSKEFFSIIDQVQFPFCFVVNTKDLSRLGVVAYSAPSIWAMFFRILSIAINKR